jgi:hypothetical protein
MNGESRLRASIARLRKGHPQGDAPTDGCPRGGALTAPPLKPEPTNAFELAVAERLAALKADIDRVENRLNWLFALIIGAAVTNIVIAFLR